MCMCPVWYDLYTHVHCVRGVSSDFAHCVLHGSVDVDPVLFCFLSQIQSRRRSTTFSRRPSLRAEMTLMMLCFWRQLMLAVSLTLAVPCKTKKQKHVQ